jgi:hypothetical protein
MRKRCGRKAVSNIIAGIIVLTLVLTALSTMIFIVQQYDAYQSILNNMSQADNDRFSENIVFVLPGVALGNCGGGLCNDSLTLANNGPSAVQIVRVYINSNSSLCSSLCIFNPSNATANATAPYTFDTTASLIDPAESSHVLALWLPSSVDLSECRDQNALCTISLVTMRGRVFSFQWPLETGVAIPSELRLDVGPFRVVYDNNLVVFTSSQTNPDYPLPQGCANHYPSTTSCYPGGWYFTPLGGQTVVFYIRLNNIGGAPVLLLDSSYLLAEGINRLTNETDIAQFYIVQPMSQECHDSYFDSSDFEPLYWSAIQYPDAGCPTPSSILPYNSSFVPGDWLGQCNLSNSCYVLSNATLGTAGRPTYVLFSSQTRNQATSNSLKSGYDYFLYLQLSYVYPYSQRPYPSLCHPVGSSTLCEASFPYAYMVSIPLIAIST